MVDFNRIASIARRYYDTRDEKRLFAEGGVLSGGEKVLLVACLIRVPGRGDGFMQPGGMADIFAKKNKINLGRLTILDDNTGRQFAQVMGWLPWDVVRVSVGEHEITTEYSNGTFETRPCRADGICIKGPIDEPSDSPA